MNRHKNNACIQGKLYLGLQGQTNVQIFNPIRNGEVVVKGSSDPMVRLILYCTLVRPILEYASKLWSLYTVKHRQVIENLRRRATKFILNYPQNLKYVDRLRKINILPLEFRRNISDLCLVFESRIGAITMDVNNFIYTYEPGYKLRNYDKNNYNLIIKHKQNYFRNSFFIRSVLEHSSLSY